MSVGVTMGKGVRTRGRDLSCLLPNSLAVVESEVKRGQLQVLGCVWDLSTGPLCLPTGQLLLWDCLCWQVCGQGEDSGWGHPRNSLQEVTSV